jgi:acyl-CoA thioesterase FadM
MSYRLRFLILMVRCFFSRPRGLLDTYELKFRAIPFIDTDFSRLFTQTYSSFMGMARWHYIFSSQFKAVALKRRWAPVTTSETITYKKSIRVFEKVTLVTKLVCWDSRRFYLHHAFLVNGEERAFALVEGLLRGPEGHLNPKEVFQVMGLTSASPPIPENFSLWIQSRTINAGS